MAVIDDIFDGYFGRILDQLCQLLRIVLFLLEFDCTDNIHLCWEVIIYLRNTALG